MMSIDNTIAVSVMARKLDEDHQTKSIWYGIWISMILRIIVIYLASYLIQSEWIKALAGIYLIYLGAKGLIARHRHKTQPKIKNGFWHQVVTIELTDTLLVIDSALAVLAMLAIHMSATRLQTKIWVIAIAMVVALVIERVIATYSIRLLGKFAFLEYVGDMLISWIGVNLIFGVMLTLFPNELFSDFVEWGFWVGMLFIFIFGWLVEKKPANNG
ncbi:MAG: hypothetical protein S4CHLAM102_16260 [Chlamydiia bacterium]|nr:hypothetical protein [Chlamydiia bacterium]